MAISAISNDRFARQQELVPAERLAEMLVTVIGVGSIGRQVALQLAAIGARRMQLIDFDHVELTNVTTQGYWAEDIGLSKVCDTERAIQRMDPSIRVELVEDRYRPKQAVDGVLFCCVDSIDTRRNLALGRPAGCLLGRWPDAGRDNSHRRGSRPGRPGHYPTTLFAASEAHPGRCAAQSTLYTANVAAGLLVHQFCRWLRRQPIDADLSLNLLASELVVSCEAA